MSVSPDRGPVKPTLGAAVSLKSLKRLKPCWLWPDRVFADGITLIDGRPGSGKSSLAASLLAHVTGGPALPGCKRARGKNVAWFAREEGYASAVVARLGAAGAKLDRCFFPQAAEREGEVASVALPQSTAALEEWIREHSIAAVVFDPILSFIASDVSVNDHQAIRSVLEPLGTMARRHSCAMLLIRHLRKGSVGSAADQGAGSYAFGAVARVQLGCYSDPDDDGRKSVAWIKVNDAGVPRTLTAVVKTTGGSACLVFGSESDRSANDLAEGQGDTAERSALDDARAYLIAELTDDTQTAEVLKVGAEKMGISPRTLRRAKLSLGIVSKLVHQSGARQWVWARPKKWPDAAT